MADYRAALEKLLKMEGGWCKVPGDNGGETYCGISRRFWPGWPGWAIITKAKTHAAYEKGPIAFSRHLAENLVLSEKVAQFYREKFWDKIGAETMPQAMAEELLEQAVNLGLVKTVFFLQKTCNALNFWHGEPLFKDLAIDGVVGAKTRAALDLVIAKRGAKALRDCLNLQQGNHYVAVAAAQPAQRKFLAGWLTRAV